MADIDIDGRGLEVWLSSTHTDLITRDGLFTGEIVLVSTEDVPGERTARFRQWSGTAWVVVEEFE